MFIDVILSYLSKCDIGVVDINECISNPCVNGATCTDAVDAYTCACVAGYTGPQCDTCECIGLSNSSQSSIQVTKVTLFYFYLVYLCFYLFVSPSLHVVRFVKLLPYTDKRIVSESVRRKRTTCNFN